MIRQATPAMFFARPASRLLRWPLAMALCVGMLLSLIHCVQDDFAAVLVDGHEVAMTTGEPTSDHSDRHMPGQADHCVAHVVAQLPVAFLVLPADLPPERLSMACSTSSRSLAGLPPFKPPRA